MVKEENTDTYIEDYDFETLLNIANIKIIDYQPIRKFLYNVFELNIPIPVDRKIIKRFFKKGAYK